MDVQAQLPAKTRVQLGSSSTSSESSSKSFSMDNQNSVPDSPPSVCIQAVCDSMKRQIISRAFYGWLAYCRHLRTVRTHLSGLVNATIVSGEGAGGGLTKEKWEELCVDGVVSDSDEVSNLGSKPSLVIFAENQVYRLAYFGGMAHDLRKVVWPYLLGHYKFGSTVEQRGQLCEETRQAYENTMSEWLAVEAIVRQRDKETQANAIAKLSSESMSGEQVPTQIQRDLSNDVFEDMISDDESEEEARPDKTRQNTIKYESDEEEGFCKNVIVTNASVDVPNATAGADLVMENNLAVLDEECAPIDCIEAHGLASPARSACVSPASSNGGVYSVSRSLFLVSRGQLLIWYLDGTLGNVWGQFAQNRKRRSEVRSKLLVLHRRKFGQTQERHVHVSCSKFSGTVAHHQNVKDTSGSTWT